MFVEDFMNRDIKYIWNGMTYQELRTIIKEGQKIRSFPLVDNPSELATQCYEFLKAFRSLYPKNCCNEIF